MYRVDATAFPPLSRQASPIVMYFNHKGFAKIKLGVAKGKQNHDKRATEAKRDWSRQKARLMKDHG